MVHIHFDHYILNHAVPSLPGIWQIIAEHSYIVNMDCSINCVFVRAHMYVCLCSGTINSQEILDWQAHNIIRIAHLFIADTDTNIWHYVNTQ